MNVSQLRAQVGQALCVHPEPQEVSSDFRSRTARQELWILAAVHESPARVVLTNKRMSRSIEIHSDSIREFRRPNILALRAQLVLRPNRIDLEPIFGSGAAPSPLGLEIALDKSSAMPILARDAYIESLIGLVVTYDGRVRTLALQASGLVRMGLIVNNYDVFYEVDKSKFPEIALMVGDEKVRVVGKLRSVGITVELYDATISVADVA